MTEWVTRWNDVIAAEAELPGVWKRRDGGYRVRGRATDPKTGQLRGVNRALPDCKKPREAAATLEAELAKIRAGAADPARGSRLPTFGEWAATVFERRVANGQILSRRGRDKWGWVLKTHLVPAFGRYFIDQITREDIERWKTTELLAERELIKDPKRKRELAGDRYSPNTCNTILEILRQIMAEASASFNFADPARTIANVNKRAHRTYTHESPNSLKPADLPRFLGEMRASYPQHYAMTMLGFTTGLRPSSLRPLRRKGAHADVKWTTGDLLIRRSQTRGTEVMDRTKTGNDQVIALAKGQLDVLRWHVETQLEHGKAPAWSRDSDLLFPAPPAKYGARGGGFRSGSCLDKPFAEIAKRMRLGYTVTPRAMRRTYQDLQRAAKTADIVTRSISGHLTEEMQEAYSTVSPEEQREAMGKVFDLATGREVKPARASVTPPKTKRSRRAA